VTSAKIIDGTVAAADIADGAVTTTKLANGAVAAGKIAAAAVATNELATGAVSNAKIADGAVTSPKIADGAIATADIANSAVTRAKVATDVWLPVAFGVVNSDGSCGPRTANVANCTRLGDGEYEITITGESYTSTSYVTVITPVGNVAMSATSSASGRLLVFLRTSSGSGGNTNRTFHFAIYKP
jgi:hypothetical protein